MKAPAARKTLEVVELATGKVVRAFDVTSKSERQIEKIEMGMLRNMDLERFSVRLVTPKANP